MLRRARAPTHRYQIVARSPPDVNRAIEQTRRKNNLGDRGMKNSGRTPSVLVEDHTQAAEHLL